MQLKVQKWGNSLAVRIPKAFATETAMEQDALIDASIVEGKIILTPISKKKYSLAELLAGITEDNLHEEVSTGISVGEESW